MELNTQTFHGYGAVRLIDGQTAVECRFTEEAQTVLASHANASLTGADAEEGGVRYYGKTHFLLVYEDGEGRVCRVERAVEFSARVKGEGVTAALTPRAKLTVENLSLRREGASVYLTATLGAEIVLYGAREFDYLTGGELVVRRAPCRLACARLFGGAVEAEDEFETAFLGDILLHAERAGAPRLVAEAGSITAEGEVAVSLLATGREGELCSFERMVPYRASIPCDGAGAGACCEGRVSVLNAAVHAEADEETGKCRLALELTLGIEGCVYEEVTVEGVTDAFSQTVALSLHHKEVESVSGVEEKRFAERAQGRAALSSPVDFSDSLQAVTLARGEATLVGGEEGVYAEGVAAATLIVRGADGRHRGVEMSLPFSLPVEGGWERAEVTVCGMSARQKQEGEIEAEATVRLTLSRQKKCSCRLVTAVEAGEELAQEDSAVSVYVPRAGDGLWELAKQLRRPPEEVEASNPDLVFPVAEGQRVIVYRKKNL